MTKRKNYFDNLDNFSRFFQHCNFSARPSLPVPNCYMLRNSGSTAPIVVMLTPRYVTVYRETESHFFSCPREEWGPDFFEECGRLEKGSKNDYETIVRNYRAYSTLDVLGKYLVDECGLRVESKKQSCYLEQTLYDSDAYYTLTIVFRDDRTYFDLNLKIEPFTETKCNVIRYGNMTDWSVETLERIGKELPIKVLSDYIKKYKKMLKSSENV